MLQAMGIMHTEQGNKMVKSIAKQLHELATIEHQQATKTAKLGGERVTLRLKVLRRRRPVLMYLAAVRHGRTRLTPFIP